MNHAHEDRRCGAGGRLTRGPWGFHRSEDGQAIYVVVVFLFLLLGLTFLVLNTGEKLSHKIEMQSAADSAAATGAAWYCRGLNVIAMCNVNQVQIMSLIILCDALETVTPPAVEVIDALVKSGQDVAIEPRLSIDPTLAGNNMKSGAYYTGVMAVVGNAAYEQKIIHQFDDIVKAVNWPDYLNYNGGILWELLKLLDGFAHAMEVETPLASQREAMDTAKKNHADFGFVLPLWPALPVVDGTFNDYYCPMVYGRMPPVNGTWNSPRGPVIGGFRYVMNYYGYRGQWMGPWSYWREPIVSTRPMGLLDLSRLSVLFEIVSQKKLDMLFDIQSDAINTVDPIDKVSLRNWEMDFTKAKGDLNVRNFWWEQVSFDCRFPNDEGKAPFPLQAGGAQDAIFWHPVPGPTTPFSNRGLDPRNGYTRATNSLDGADPRKQVWYKVTQRKTYLYHELGITQPHAPPYGPPTHPEDIQYIYWHVQIYRFDGAEKDPDTTLHRNYLPPAGDKPNLAPILFDKDKAAFTFSNIDQYFTFNGVAYRKGQVNNWPSRFVNPNPNDNLVCYAQARVYMRYSWDMFSQDWHVKLVQLGGEDSSTDPWARMSSWLNQSIPSGAVNASEVTSVLTDDRKDPVKKMLQGYNATYVKEVTH